MVGPAGLTTTEAVFYYGPDPEGSLDHGGPLMSKKRGRGLVLITLLFFPLFLGSQTAQEREMRAASFLVQADDAYAEGDYEKAVESYLLVVQTSANRMNLSRAYMGLSLCYFYLDDVPNAEKYILSILETDPEKDVSPLFHPQAYVDLFNKVKKENEGRLKSGVVSAPIEPAQEARAKLGPGQQVLPEEALGKRGGHFEVEVHYSGWSIDPAKGAFEGTITKRIANEVRDQVTEQLRQNYGGTLIPSSYGQSLSLDSQGSNYGFEVRYYPRGRGGSMSIGFSLEKTRIEMTLKGPVTQRYADGSAATVEVDSLVKTNPTTVNLSFRWDIVPSWRVTPYLVVGLGIGPLEGTASYVYAGNYRRGSGQAGITGEETKSFDELRAEEEIGLDRFVLLHTALGFKGDVYRGVTLKGEIGFWDGLVLRGGLAYRF
jgi:hypothetical protein